MSKTVAIIDLPCPDEREWRARLADLALQCSSAAPVEAPELLTELHALLLAAPVNFGWLRAKLPSEQRIAALLRSDATSSAALALVEHRAGYMLSQGPGGRAMATLVLVGAAAETCCSAADPALALAGALAEALSRAHYAAMPGVGSGTAGAHSAAVLSDMPAGARFN